MSTTQTAAGATLQIRPLTRADLSEVVEIENASFSTPWKLATFEALLRRDDTDLVAAVSAGRLVGYAVSWTVLDQAELGNVAVAPEARGAGIGRRLVDGILQRIHRRGARECFLEVRESNLGAQSLYRTRDFQVIGRRPRYYSRPLEDALVMRKSF